MVRDLDTEVHALVDAGRTEDARALLASIQGATKSRWGQVLALPTARSQPGTGRGDFLANMDWLRDHGEPFAGQWVALSDGALLDHDLSYSALHARLVAAGLTMRALVTQVE